MNLRLNIKDWMIAADQGATDRGTQARIVVPSPGVDVISTSPPAERARVTMFESP